MQMQPQPDVRRDRRHAAACVVATATVLAALSWPARIAGSTAPPLSDEELVKRAELILQGVVARVDYRMSTVRTSADARWPHTFVTFQVERILKGRHTGLSNLFTLRLTGGANATAGRFMRLEGCPDFDVNERVVLFVRRNERALCPIAGWGQGRFRIADGQVFSEPGREVWLAPSNRLLFGPRHDLPEERIHHRGGSVYATRVRGPRGAEGGTSPQSVAGVRLSLPGFLDYVSSVVKRVHSALELSSLPAVTSASPDRPFYVAPLGAVGDPAPQK
jgi:hypothetical protein